MTLPDTGYLRLPQVLQFIPVSESTWLRGVRAGRYPKGILLGVRIRAWAVEDIREFIEEGKR